MNSIEKKTLRAIDNAIIKTGLSAAEINAPQFGDEFQERINKIEASQLNTAEDIKDAITPILEEYFQEGSDVKIVPIKDGVRIEITKKKEGQKEKSTIH